VFTSVRLTRLGLSYGRIPVIVASLVTGAVSLPEARNGLVRICAALLTSAQRTALPFPAQLSALEPLIVDRQSLLGSTVAESVENILAEDRTFESSDQSTSVRTLQDGTTAGSVDEAPQSLDDDVVRRATLLPGFRACHLTVAGLDVTTALGRRQAIEHAFGSGSTLLVRLMCYGERSLAKRHPLLQTLLNCRGDMDLGGYFGYCLTVDVTTGTRPARAENWSMAGSTGTEIKLLRAALRMDLLAHDFYHSPGGVYPLKTVMTGTMYNPVHSADFWTRPECVIDYCTYMHTLVVSMGSAATVAAGFTFKTWGGSDDSFYIKHLRTASTLLNRTEQFRWLEFADEQMRGFITYASRTLRATIQLARPGEGEFGALVPDDAPPPTLLREKQTKLTQFLDHRDEWGWLGADAKREPVDPGSLPRLSSRRKGDDDGKPETKSEREKRAKKERERKEREKKERKEREKRGREHGDDADRPGKSKKPENQPGALKNQAVWLTPKTGAKPELLVSGRVWDVKCLAQKHGTSVGAKCWETICCARLGDNKLALCPCPNATGHKSASDAAHVLTGFNFDEAADSCSRPASAAEKKKVPGRPSFRQPASS
jgi:hypothetical protein